MGSEDILMLAAVPEGELDKETLETFGRIQSILTEYEKERKKSNITLSNITKAQEKIKKNIKQEHAIKSQLKDMYETARHETMHEIDLMKQALNVIQEAHITRYKKVAAKDSEKRREGISKKHLMNAIIAAGMSLPLWVGKSCELPPPLCGAVPPGPNYIAQRGDLVAALVHVADENTWILAEVIGFNRDRNVYRVDDIDEKLKSEHVIKKDKVIPLPKLRANPEINPCAIYPKESLVLALYPQTTCFYRAAVFKTPAKHGDPYEVCFEDVTFETGYSQPKIVYQRYIIPCKELPAHLSAKKGRKKKVHLDSYTRREDHKKIINQAAAGLFLK